jgi:hypothetical protein
MKTRLINEMFTSVMGEYVFLNFFELIGAPSIFIEEMAAVLCHFLFSFFKKRREGRGTIASRRRCMNAAKG